MSKMLEEIRQQPVTLERTLRSHLKTVEQLRKVLKKRRPRLVVLVARGTSDNAATFGRYLLEITTGIPVSLAAPSIFTVYEASVDLHDVLLVAVSQSGESTDTNLVLERAKEQGAMTIGITNEAGSTLAKLTEHAFLVHAGRERSVAATKTYTGQLMSLYLLAYALGAKIHLDDLNLIPAWVERALGLEADIRERAQRYRFMDHAAVVARGLNYSNAFEFGLKMMETCYVVAERFSSADFLHGPIAIVGRAFPVFLFAPSGPTWPAMKEMMDKLHQRNAETLVITDSSNREAVTKSNRTIELQMQLSHRGIVPADLFTPIPYIIPAQVFAACLAEEKLLDPDKPRGLMKVTQTM